MSFDGRLLAGITVLAAVVQGRSFARAGEALEADDIKSTRDPA